MGDRRTVQSRRGGHTGKLPWQGVGWYRKTFTLDPADAGKQVYLDFDGVMAFPKVYVNGKLAGEWDYGYTSFRIDATPFVKFGEPNTVAVRVDTTKHGTRWYPGAGIYRKVTLTVAIRCTSPNGARTSRRRKSRDAAATVNVRTTIENHGDQDADASVDGRVDQRSVTSSEVRRTRIDRAADTGRCSRTGSTFRCRSPTRSGGTSTTRSCTPLQIDGPRRRQGRRHRERRTFGIRTFEFTADDGFHLNGRRVQLHGVCLHHDQGPLGGAFYPRAMERQLEIMRDMGVNAIRTSHNPPGAELLDLCDRMGFVVWDECFDKWDDKADRVDGQPSLEEHGERHLRSLVMRDRNHPSVVVWSIGNEIGDMRRPRRRSPRSASR